MQLPESAQGIQEPLTAGMFVWWKSSADGGYLLDGRRFRLDQVEAELVKTFRDNPKLTVDIRADKRAEWDYVFAVMDACMRNHITRISPRTVRPRNR